MLQSVHHARCCRLANSGQPRACVYGRSADVDHPHSSTNTRRPAPGRLLLPGLFLFQGRSEDRCHIQERQPADRRDGRHARCVVRSRCRCSGQIAVRNQGYVPFSDAPINYRGDVDDPVARLQKRLDRGEATLAYEPKHGYLQVGARPAEGPGQLADAGVLEDQLPVQEDLAADAARALLQRRRVRRQGARRQGDRVRLVRREAGRDLLPARRAARPSARCFSAPSSIARPCHVAATTRNVPGVLIRSIFPTPTGTQAPQTPVVHHRPPEPARASAGAAGTSPARTAPDHMGNACRTGASDLDRRRRERLDLSSVRHLRLSRAAQRHRRASGAGASDADAQPDHADELPDAARALCEADGRGCRPSDAVARTKARRRAGALSAVRGRGAARRTPSRGRPGSPRTSRRAGRAMRRAARCATSICRHAALQVSVQLPDLLRGLRRAAGAGQGVRLSPAARDPDRPRSERGVREADARQIAGPILEILLATKAGLPAEWKRLHETKQQGRTRMRTFAISGIGGRHAGRLGRRPPRAPSRRAIGGRWDATVTVNEAVIPFRLDISGDGADAQGHALQRRRTGDDDERVVRERHGRAEPRALPDQDRRDREGRRARRARSRCATTRVRTAVRSSGARGTRRGGRLGR